MLSLVMFLMPAVSMAGRDYGNNRGDRGRDGNDSERNVRVSSHNSATITNNVNSRANTGGNWAGGSYGGDAGSGGDIEAGKNGDVDGAGTGAGGNGGGSSDGGQITTGPALTETLVVNAANSNNTRVSDDCGCEDNRGDREVNVRVRSNNNATVTNNVDSRANTGRNNAEGSHAGDGGHGGDIEAGHWDGDVDDSGTGRGGNGGNSGFGGTVITSGAGTSTAVVTVLNRNVTRVR